jgi:hypothetical protein
MIAPEAFVEEAAEKIARVIGAVAAPGARRDRMVADAVAAARDELRKRYGEGATDVPALVDQLRQSLTDHLLRDMPVCGRA